MTESADSSVSKGEVNALDALETLILRANRFVSRIAETDVFRKRDLGVAEWLALRALGKAGKETFTSLAGTLGVTRQRVKQIADSLKQANLVNVNSSGEDKRKSEIEISETGRNLLAGLEVELNEKLSGVKGGMSPATRAGSVLMRLTRTLGGGPDGKAARRAAKGGKKERGNKADRIAARAARQSSGSKTGRKAKGREADPAKAERRKQRQAQRETVA